ncbi:FUN14 domain-containing protein [Phanerochaete sordida]|uniref:FUN14 domain-containing protein n=1 Tax=Phanerochaete sordida TaxID=48140 RepID=A0A9P3G1A8_9APHY|nr:FUN14 domain-containing protein [Phanerochaete sordida]
MTSRPLCSMPFTLTHQLRASIFNAPRAQLRRYATGTSAFARPSVQPWTLQARAHVAARGATRTYVGVATLGLAGFSFLAAQKPIHCEPDLPPQPHPHTVPTPGGEPLPPPPQSSVNAYELTFGTVCGICAGVFVKKGAKALAFVLGGVFVLLQYFGSLNLIRIDWARMSKRFENLFYTTDATGAKRAPSVGSLVRWIIDFLTADFQQRASFIAGFALGIRVG